MTQTPMTDTNPVTPADAMEFFKQSAGTWHSQRTTHHLPFRRAELGGSEIFVETLPLRILGWWRFARCTRLTLKLPLGGVCSLEWRDAMGS